MGCGASSAAVRRASDASDSSDSSDVTAYVLPRQSDMYAEAAPAPTRKGEEEREQMARGGAQLTREEQRPVQPQERASVCACLHS